MIKEDKSLTHDLNFYYKNFAPPKLVELQPTSIENLRQLTFQHMQDGFSIVDANGLHVDVNPAFCWMTGFSAQELIGFSPEHLYWPPEDREHIKAAFARTLRGEFSELELTFIRKSGERFPATVTPFAIRDKHSDNLFYAAMVRDITQQVQLQTALQTQEEQYHRLFKSTADAIVILQGEKIIDCNQQTLELYGLSRDEILSNTAASFFPPTQPNGMNSRAYFLEMVEASRTGNPQIFEWYGRRRDGTSVITEVTLTTFMLDDKQFEQSISRDITQRKQMESTLVDLNQTLEYRVVQRTQELERACAELLQRNAQYRELAKKLTRAEEEERKRIARLLHDNHQQLLAAAKFKVEMLQSGIYGSVVNKEGRQILEILDQALDVTRSLTMELAPSIHYCQGFVIAMQWLGRWMEEHHKLRVFVQGCLPMTPMPTDISSLLFRATRELLLNVCKHSGVQQAHVKIALTDESIQVTVSDKGVGFDVADALDTRSYGLFSIQEQLLALHGRLDVSSSPGGGTSTTLTIPMPDGDTDSPASENPASKEHSASADVTTENATGIDTTGRPIRILVADDHTMAREALVQILGLAADFEVVGAAVDGQDAVEKARALRPDVILMDASMPRMDGLEATRLITSEFPGAKVIGLSMHASESMQPQMIAAGAVSYLQKLTPGEELFAAIRGVMNAPLTNVP